jgi:hypothetical protein
MAQTITAPSAPASAPTAVSTTAPFAVTVQLPPQLPPDVHWTSYGTALGAPFVALVAALIAGSIAYRQWKTAQNKLKMDLFDKRFEAYQKVAGALGDMIQRRFTYEEYATFRNAVNHIDWLCEDSLTEYLKEKWDPDAIRFAMASDELSRLNKPNLEVAQQLHKEQKEIIDRGTKAHAAS